MNDFMVGFYLGLSIFVGVYLVPSEAVGSILWIWLIAWKYIQNRKKCDVTYTLLGSEINTKNSNPTINRTLPECIKNDASLRLRGRMGGADGFLCLNIGYDTRL